MTQTNIEQQKEIGNDFLIDKNIEATEQERKELKARQQELRGGEIENGELEGRQIGIKEQEIKTRGSSAKFSNKQMFVSINI